MTSIEERQERYEEKLAEAVGIAAENRALDWHIRVNPQCPEGTFACPRYRRLIVRLTNLVLSWPLDRHRTFIEEGAWESWADIAGEHDTPSESALRPSDGALVLDLALSDREMQSPVTDGGSL